MATRPATKTPASLAIEWWPLEKVKPYAANPRQIPQSAIDKVAASLAAYGWRQPLVVGSDGVIIVGHVRLLAARKLGQAQVPVHVANLSAEEARAYRLADNRTAEESSWNPELLGEEIAALLECDYDLDLTGFDSDELAAVLTPAPLILGDPDDVPEAPAEPISQRGDLWLLGRHRLLCGDATDAADVARVMDGARATLMATDPPYLVNYDGGNHPQTWANGGKRAGREVATKTWDAYTDQESAVAFYVAFLEAALKHALRPDAAVYQCYAILKSEFIWQAWREVGLLPHQVVIWKKSRAVLTHSWYLWDYEPVMVGWSAGHQPKAKPPADQRAVWEIASAIEDGAGGIHPTQKPVELIRRPIEYHTKVGEVIFEPFCGSGTAIIAAELTGRSCCALELAPAFCDVAVERYRRLTGEEVRRDG